MWTTYIMYPYEYQYEYECEYDTKYTTSEVWVLESNHLELIFEYLRLICMIGSDWTKKANLYEYGMKNNGNGSCVYNMDCSQLLCELLER